MNLYEIILSIILLLSLGFSFYTKKNEFIWLTIIGIILAIGLKFFDLNGALKFFSLAVSFILFASTSSYLFRTLLVLILPKNLSREFKTAPLTAAFGLLIILIYFIAAVFAPLIAPFSESEIIAGSFALADDKMLLGADQLGRDLFSRLIYGTRNSVGLALSATLAAFIMGTVAGLIAVTQGGRIDQILGRISDVIMSIPSLIFALLVLSILGPSIAVIVLAVSIIYTPRVFRLTRAVAGSVVVMDFIEAARLRGEKNSYLIFKEILPNSTAPLIAEFGLEFCFVFLLVAGLSFLGLGIQPPTADWGSMVRENATLISFGEIIPLIPAAAIALLTVSVNFVVDWMLYRSSGLKEQK